MTEIAATLAPAWVRWAAAVVRRLPAGRYRAMNRLGRRPVPPFWAATGHADGAYRFRCDLRDGIAREVCFTGRYEPQETAILKAVLRPGDVFVDVGANWGYFTLLAAALIAPRGRVVSLEPDPRTFAVLRQNVVANGLAVVTPICVAAADTTGVMALAGFAEEDGNFGLSRLAAGWPGTGQVFQVQTRPLDDVLGELAVPRVDLLKVDIEGAEGMALRGLARSLSQRRVARLLLELHPPLLARHGDSVMAIFAQLADAGYRPWRVDHSPAATRRAAYDKAPAPRSLVRPLAAGDPLDEWPHLLWAAPEVDLFP